MIVDKAAVYALSFLPNSNSWGAQHRMRTSHSSRVAMCACLNRSSEIWGGRSTAQGPRHELGSEHLSRSQLPRA
jgi:hypothetical protein